MYATLNEVTALAQSIIIDSDDKDRNVWRNWAFQATLELGIGDDEIRVADLYPQNYVAPLPEDCRHIIEIAAYDAAGNELKTQFRSGNKRIFTDNRLLVGATTGSDVNADVPVDVSNDRTNLYLGTNGSNVAMIAIRYFAYPLDEDGQPLIREEDKMACVYFIRYMNAMRKNQNQSEIQMSQQSWFHEADRARARKKMASMTPAKAKALMSSLNRLIPNFRSINSF